MLYQKEIDDAVLIQFIILFTLGNVDSPVEYSDLLNLVMNNCNINFNDFQIALDNLETTGHVQTFIANSKQRFAVTQKGENAGEFFKSHIPVYIREPIEQSIKDLFIEERKRNAVRGDISPIKRGEYTAECSLYDDDNTMLMHLSLYAGSRSEAEKLVRYYKEHSDKVYSKILEGFDEKE